MVNKAQYGVKYGSDTVNMTELTKPGIHAQQMGYEMRPIGRQTDAPRLQSGGRPPVSQDRTFRSQPRTGRDYSKFRCFSCGQFGHMQARCPKPDASLPYKPAGWFLQSEGNGQRDQRNRTENSP